jgi:alkanesulfonate monooxygenase
MQNTESPLRIFTTCPPYGGSPPDQYLSHLRDVARWSDEAGCAGILVYTDNSVVDPWLVSQIIIQSTRTLMPLVAVQPVYTHPYTVAKAVSSLSYLHGRRICLNMVAGGFKNDLVALNDPTPHQRRYDRLVEYTSIVKQLLKGEGPVTFTGEFYAVHQLALKPPLPPELFPVITISGSSPEGIAAARALEAIPVRYPEPAGEHAAGADPAQPGGVRVGIIAREEEREAWAAAHQRFPPDHAGKIMHGLAMRVSDSLWHKQLSDLAHETEASRSTYWLEPFQNYKTFCPYLVGSYEQVSGEIRKYVLAGSRVFILDVPTSPEELAHIRKAFSQAVQEVSSHAVATHD